MPGVQRPLPDLDASNALPSLITDELASADAQVVGHNCPSIHRGRRGGHGDGAVCLRATLPDLAGLGSAPGQKHSRLPLPALPSLPSGKCSSSLPVLAGDGVKQKSSPGSGPFLAHISGVQATLPDLAGLGSVPSLPTVPDTLPKACCPKQWSRARYQSLQERFPSHLLTLPQNVGKYVLQREQEKIAYLVEKVFEGPDRSRVDQLLMPAFPEVPGRSLAWLTVALVAATRRNRIALPSHQLLQVVEGGAGQGHLSQQCLAEGLRVKAMDILYGETYNLENCIGIRTSLLWLTFTCSPAVQWLGVVCSSHVWISSGTSKRTRDNPMGDESRRFVKSGNNMAYLAAYQVTVAEFIEVESVVEQPISSTLDRLAFVAKAFHATSVTISTTPLGAFGAPSQKLVRLYHCSQRLPQSDSLTWVQALKRPVPRNIKFKSLVRNSKGKVSGVPRLLKASGAYPPAFGAAAAQGLKRALSIPLPAHS